MAFDAYRVHALALRQRRALADAPPLSLPPFPGRVCENRTGSQPDHGRPSAPRGCGGPTPTDQRGTDFDHDH